MELRKSGLRGEGMKQLCNLRLTDNYFFYK